MLPQWIIEKKRDGAALSRKEIDFFVEGFTGGGIPDYQMAALAMAIYFRGLSSDETAALTDAMVRSGRTLDTSVLPAPKIDKHSTGGIGDKVSLILAPLVACCGVAVPMISGRSLGITGGTLDKLESIPGYRTDLSPREFLDVLRGCGCSIIGQTADLAPADRKLYALRDVTGTVPSIPLIAASIMSKKLAEGIDGLVLDVKWGRGAFMPTIERARELAHAIIEAGAQAGKAVAAVITDMNQPLGRAVGNALEVVEAVETLSGRGPADLVDVTVELGAQMLGLAGKAESRDAARSTLSRLLDSGAALDRFRDMVRRHGGRTDWIDRPEALDGSRLRREHRSPRPGYVADVDAGTIGRAAMVLGAGRRRVEDRIDPVVGLVRIAKIGQAVEQGEPLAVLCANAEAALAEAGAMLADAFRVTPEPVTPPKLVVEILGGTW